MGTIDTSTSRPRAREARLVAPRTASRHHRAAAAGTPGGMRERQRRPAAGHWGYERLRSQVEREHALWRRRRRLPALEPPVEAGEAEANTGEVVTPDEWRHRDELGPDEAAVHAGGVRHVLRRRVLLSVRALLGVRRWSDGVGHDIVVERPIAQHTLHDVAQRPFRVRPAPRGD